MTAVARRGELSEEFAGEARLFRLDLGLLEEVEAATGRGIFEVFDRFFSGRASVREVRAVLFHGLIGGGGDRKAAADLIAEYITAETALSCQVIARAVIGVALAPDLAEDSSAKKPTGDDLPTDSLSGV